MRIPFLKPNITEEDIFRMNEAMRSGWLAPGKKCEQVEEMLCKYLQVKNAKLTSSCTMALLASLIMAGVKEGDEVITTPLSWVATSNVILYLGAKPVFVDVDSTGRIDPFLMAITPKTKAIVPVHIYGQICDMEEINSIAKKHNIKVIEDAAHAPIPSIGTGDYACLSFHVAKNLTCGNGGAIVSNNPIDERLLYHGVERIDGKRRMTGWGYKGEMTDFQAALLIGQIERAEEMQKKRRVVVERYSDGLAGITRLNRTSNSADHLFVILAEDRDEVRKKLADKGIETSIHYEPINSEPYYSGLGYKSDCPITQIIGRKNISLPTYPSLTEDEQNYIIKEILCVLH